VFHRNAFFIRIAVVVTTCLRAGNGERGYSVSVCAASCASLTVRADSGRFGFTSRAMTAALGTSSCSSPSPLPLSRGPKKLTPENQHGLRHLAATARRCAIAGRLGQQSDEGRVGMRGFVLGSMLMLAMVSGAMPYPVALTILTLRWSSASAPLTIASVSIEPRTKPLIPTLPSSDCCPRRPAIALYPRSPFPARKQVVTTPTIPIKKAL